MIKDYEVEGCWTTKKSERKRKCRNCGALEELVPEEGHFNSRYWNLKRNDGLDLFCCPNGCSVKDAESKMKYFIAFYKYMIEGSESYNYKLDYKKIRFFWLDKKGRMYPCESNEHEEIAVDFFNCSSLRLKNNGFIESIFESKNNICLISENKITKKQVNILIDWMHDNNIKTKEFMEEIESGNYCFSVYFKEGIFV